MVYVGELTISFTSKLCPTPFANCVLPAPNSPLKATTVGTLGERYFLVNSFAKLIVSSALLVLISSIFLFLTNASSNSIFPCLNTESSFSVVSRTVDG